MRFRTLALVLTSVLLAGAAPAAPPSELLQPIRTVLNAFNAGSSAQLSDPYAPQTTVVDEIAPYTWTGAGAGQRWLADFMRFAARSKIVNGRVSMSPIKTFGISGNRAYVAVPIRYVGNMNRKPFVETGIWAFTLIRSRGEWMITTQSWGTSALSM